MNLDVSDADDFTPRAPGSFHRPVAQHPDASCVGRVMRQDPAQICVAALLLSHTFAHRSGTYATQLQLLGAEDEPNYKMIYGGLGKTQGGKSSGAKHGLHYPVVMTILRCTLISQCSRRKIASVCVSSMKPGNSGEWNQEVLGMNVL